MFNFIIIICRAPLKTANIIIIIKVTIFYSMLFFGRDLSEMFDILGKDHGDAYLSVALSRLKSLF